MLKINDFVQHHRLVDLMAKAVGSLLGYHSLGRSEALGSEGSGGWVKLSGG